METRWGSKQELIKACETANQYGLDVLVDAVLNVSNHLLELIFLLMPHAITSINMVETQLSMRRLSLQIHKIASRTLASGKK